MSSICPLCHSKGLKIHHSRNRDYYQCKQCTGVFVGKVAFLSANEEKKRYDNHSDDITQKGYQDFVSPCVLTVVNNFKTTDKGLDFGCGRSEVVAKLLQQKGYDTVGYDPYYKPNTYLLNSKYNYITSCEVIEHFNTPAVEFQRLKSLLLPNGKLILQTSILTSKIDFESWYYKNDPTHVFFYTQQCFQYIQSFYGFTSLEIENNLAVLSF